MTDRCNKLKEWMLHFLKHKDLLTKNIISIEDNISGFDFLIKRKAEDQFVLIREKLDNIDQITKLIDNKNVMIILANTRPNLDSLISNWSKLIKFPKLVLFFVNPNLNNDKKWSIYPYTHNNIIDRASLRKGLEALFEAVNEWK